MTNGRKLVIVESPAKARVISSYLGPEFDVEASIGHIRDLPQPSELPKEMKKGPFGKFAVDVDNGFEPYYVVDADKRKKVTELRAKLKSADELFLATDVDREGEAIAWHLHEVLKPKVPVRRMVFQEITKEAIERAMANTRDLDLRLVDAQETRRILDRLYGYEVSPVLWRKVRQGLSAGRVQSVATRLVVDRERDRIAFVTAAYWDILGQFVTTDDQPFQARLVSLDGARVATGRDFNDKGELTAPARKAGVVVLDEQIATAVATALTGAEASVRAVENKPYKRRPAAPFTTATLQQEASRKLRMNSATTMRLAQTLYENGYITYMRTDSPALSRQAVAAARKQATSLYGAEYVPAKPRIYSAKSDSAQEAHEAIRPAGDSFRTPDQVRAELRADQFRLYELIWKRTVASQMADAVGSTSTLRLGAVAGGYDGEFAASGTVITFRGFLAAYEEGRDETDPQDDEVRLPALASGDSVRVDELTVEDHATNPPARYTEASLIRALEERGIGRPSTYAATISVIVDRGYVYHRGQALVPSWLAFAVTQLLEKHFEWLVDYEFTAEMESDLDEIAAGDQDRVDWLTRFYFGDGTGHPGGEGLQDLVANLGDIDAREVNSVTVRDGTVVRVGRYGPYLEEPSDEEDGTPRRVSIPDTIAPDELTPAVVVELLTAKPDEDIVLGQDPDTGTTIVAKDGRYGPYVTEVFEEEKKKPRTASLLKSMSLSTVTLADALQLLSLPRLVGTDPNTGEDITAQNGRYGPYLKRGTDSRSLQTEESIFTITLDEALALYAQPKTRRGRAAAAPLRELGTDPATGKPVVVKDGRYGPYVTDGETNATLRKMDSVENVTLDRAAELLAEKRAKPPTKRTARRSTKKTGKTATGKTTTGKTTTGKTTTGKTTTKRTSAGKKTSQQKASE